MQFFDGLMNLVSGLGTSRDKGATAYYAAPVYSALDYLNAYKSSAFVRRAIDLPADDACREWREWQAQADEIGLIEAEETRLHVLQKVRDAKRLARIYGCAAIIIGTGDTDTTKPLNPAAVRQSGLKYLTVISGMDFYAPNIDQDPTSPRFGQPTAWLIGAKALSMHPSRMVVFHGVEPLAGIAMNTRNGQGDSVLAGMLDPLRRVEETAANVNSLVYEAKIDVIKIPDLMRNLESFGKTYEDQVIRRMTLAATGKGINGTLIMDKDEDYDQKSASFGGLPEVMDRQMQLASGATGIPMTILFGMSPGGMNATGESDVRTYYDRVKVEQTVSMSPAMSILDECIIMSALGNRPPEIHYKWRPLWQLSATQKAENADKIMSALTKLHALQVIPPEAVADAAVNALTEGGATPGLEGYVAEYEMADPLAEEPIPNDPAIL